MSRAARPRIGRSGSACVKNPSVEVKRMQDQQPDQPDGAALAEVELETEAVAADAAEEEAES